MKSPKPPAAPDPVATANAQGQANAEAVRESARVNQINEVTPWGSLSYSGDIGSPDRTRTTTLSPEAQAQYDRDAALADSLGGLAQNRAGQIDQGRFSLDGLPELNTDFSGDAGRVEQATYDRAMGLMRPDFDRQERDLETKLATRGIPIGGEAYNDVRGQFDQSRNEAQLAAALDAVGAGRSEQSRLFNMTNAARQQGINERLTERTQPMNELAAILQGSPAMGQPNFGQAAQYQVAPADYMGAVGMQQAGLNNAYNQRVGSRNAMMGGLFSLGGAAMAAPAGTFAFMCSPDFKENGRPVSEILPRIDALTVEAWDYKNGIGDGRTHIGPYADEFKKLFGVGDGRTIPVVDAFGVCLLGIKELLARVEYLEAQHG